MTQIPSDKLKMIDSESKMETAPQGMSDCPHLCPRASARFFKCMHEQECCTVTSSANPQLMQACKCCRCEWVHARTVCMYICVHCKNGRVGLLHWIPDTFQRMWEDGRYPMCEPQSHQHACNTLSCVSCQHQLKAWNLEPKSVKKSFKNTEWAVSTYISAITYIYPPTHNM